MSNKVSLFFPISIYPEKAIVAAVDDYAHICTIRIGKSKTGIECTFTNSVADLHLTAREFSNYLIELINKGGK